jgi:hypothetical protein
MGCALLLCGVTAAPARDAHDLTGDELRVEMDRNTTLRGYVHRNGPPDIAESHLLADRPPWEDHEVTLYYLDRHKEIGFARASILGRPEIHLIRYERPLTDEQVAALGSRARARTEIARSEAARMKVAGVHRHMGPAERAEDAAARAEAAATKVELAADSAEHAADRAEAIASRMESTPRREPRKK